MDRSIHMSAIIRQYFDPNIKNIIRLNQSHSFAALLNYGCLIKPLAFPLALFSVRYRLKP